MIVDPSGVSREPRPPLGSWARLYGLVCVLAVVVMLVLWAFTARFNIRLGAA